MTQMPISEYFVSARVLFDGAFSLWVSLKYKQVEAKAASINHTYL